MATRTDATEGASRAEATLVDPMAHAETLARQELSARAQAMEMSSATPQQIPIEFGRSRMDIAREARTAKAGDDPGTGDLVSMAEALAAAQAADRAGKPGQQAPAAQPTPAPASSAPAKPVEKPIEAPAAPTKGVQPLDALRPKTPSKAAQWDEAKKAAFEQGKAEAAAEMASLKEQISAAKAAGDPGEATRLKEQLKQYQDIVRGIAIERDPEFVQRFDARRKAVIDIVKPIAGENAAQLAALLAQPPSIWRDSQINTLLEDVTDPAAQRRINAALTTLEGIDIERATEVAARQATFTEAQAQAALQQQHASNTRAQATKVAFETELRAWSDPTEGIAYLQTTNDDAHNAAVAETTALAKRIYFGDRELTDSDLARAAMWSAIAPRLASEYQALQEQHAALKTELAKIKGAAPGAGQSTALQGGEESPPAPGSPGYDSYFQKQLKDAQARDASVARM